MEHGFDERMVEVYASLLQLGSGQVKEVQKRVNAGVGPGLSYAQVRNALERLRAVGAVERQAGTPAVYLPLNPKVVFEGVREARLAEIDEVEEWLSDLYERGASELGKCTLQVNNFYFKNLTLGFKVLSERFVRVASGSVVLIAAPPLVLKRLRWALKEAYERGAEVEVHYSGLDFEELPSYLSAIKPLISFRATIFKRKYRLYEASSVDDQFTRVGSLIIDRTSFVSFPYFRASSTGDSVEYGIDFLHGFNKFSFAPSILDSLSRNPVLERMEWVPPREASVLEYLKSKPRARKHAMSAELGISGTELKRVLGVLERHGRIRVRRQRTGKGRPTDVVELARWEPEKAED
ncbi:MAG: hypothetical protein Kow0069_27950 [Promethearchaeota archaeon]